MQCGSLGSFIVKSVIFLSLRCDIFSSVIPESDQLKTFSLSTKPLTSTAGVSNSSTRITRRLTPPPSTSTTASSVTLLPPRAVPDAWTQLVELSRRTNELQRQMQQAQCNRSVPTTDTGAWCHIAVRSLHLTDEPLAASLAELFRGKTVLSLGEGRGDYRKLVLNASSQVKPSLCVTFAICYRPSVCRQSVVCLWSVV